MCPPIDRLVDDLQKEPCISKDLLRCLPSDNLSHGSYQLAESILPRAILNHSVRVFLIADWLLQREHKELDPPINRSLLCVACLLHDVGCAQQFDGPQRFEIEGADAAVRFLLEQGVPKPNTVEVWQAIALHTTPGIAERISPFVCLVRKAVLFDFNQQLESTSSEIRSSFEKLFPRLEIEKALGDTVVDQALRQPEKAPPASWPGILASGPLQNASVWSSSPTAGFGTGNTDENDCVIDRAFANITYNLTTNLTRTSNTCMTRIFNETFFDTVSQKVVDSCMDIDDYWKMWACLGNTPHTGGHLGVGGTMEHVSMSAFDPVFSLHHANLDRLWTQWQSRDTKQLKAIGGPRIALHTLFGEAQPASLGLSAFVPYFGDKGNVTTLSHNIFLTGITCKVDTM